MCWGGRQHLLRIITQKLLTTNFIPTYVCRINASLVARSNYIFFNIRKVNVDWLSIYTTNNKKCHHILYQISHQHEMMGYFSCCRIPWCNSCDTISNEVLQCCRWSCQEIKTTLSMQISDWLVQLSDSQILHKQ